MKAILAFAVFVFTLFFLSIPTFAAEASLRCSPATGTFRVGDAFTVEFILDTRGYAAYGADVNADYDSSIFETVGTQTTPVTVNTGWTAPTTNTIDINLGHIQLDYGNIQKSATISASIGQVTFRAKAAGQGQFNYSFFQPNDDTTPGVAKIWGKKDGSNLSNILTDVNNCIYLVEGTSTVPSVTPTGNIAYLPTNTPIPLPTTVISQRPPRTGGMEMTLGAAGIGGLLFLLGNLTWKQVGRK